MLDYNPNSLAREFRVNKSNTIITILSDIRNPIFAEIIKGMEDIAYNNGYRLLIGNSDNNKIREMNYIENLKMKKADGAILITPRIDTKVLEELYNNVPLVLINDYSEDSLIPRVGINDYQASYDITKYLISKGHSFIGCLAGKSEVSIAQERRRGCERALKDNGLSIKPEWFLEIGHTYEEAYEAMKRIIAMEERPTSLVCYNDEIAIGAMCCASDFNVSVPMDISIVGFDNISTSTIIKPKLTTVHQPKYELGMRAMNILIDMIKGCEVNNTRIITKYTIMERDSVTDVLGI
jgi:LacI family repressor for deo operon, udp, cdd, tsx, nupC, and nupG